MVFRRLQKKSMRLPRPSEAWITRLNQIAKFRCDSCQYNAFVRCVSVFLSSTHGGRMVRFFFAVAVMGLFASECEAQRRPLRNWIQQRRAVPQTQIQSGSYQSSYSTDGTTSTYQQSATTTTTTGSAGVEFGTLLGLHNQVRAQRGLPPLAIDPTLMAEAQASANEQARRGRIGHHLALSGPENAAAGQTSEWQVHFSWVRSPGHFASILTPGATRVGFGFAQGPGGPYWAARFR